MTREAALVEVNNLSIAYGEASPSVTDVTFSLEEGEILVIGGLMDNRNEKQFSKVPILGDIPLLGKLFQYARKTKDKVELYIFVKATTEEW